MATRKQKRDNMILRLKNNEVSPETIQAAAFLCMVDARPITYMRIADEIVYNSGRVLEAAKFRGYKPETNYNFNIKKLGGN
jgi:hypothetical protein